MSRYSFERADIDVGLFDDIKVKRLVRLLNDPAKVHHALILYIAAVLDSWAESSPSSLVDSAPIWTDVPDEIVAALVSVELIDDEGRIRAASFDSWVKPAIERVEERREKALRANEIRWDRQRSAGSIRSESSRSPQGVHQAKPYQAKPIGRAPATGGSGRARENGEVAETPREAGETLKAYLSRIGAPIPDLATKTETNDGENRPEGRSDDDGQSRPKPRRRAKATG
jgi:hypothetical protein